jgi:ABC-2 type transport system permease protein
VSVRNTLRAFPAMLRVSFAEAVAYRAEMLVWVLATTMPLIMLSLWTAVARDAPIGRYGQKEFTAYFLTTFIIRQLTGAWAAWHMNYEVRQGTLSMRLLRPVHPLWAYAIENIAAFPMRVIVAVPMAGVLLWTAGSALLPKSAAMWLLVVVSIMGGWLITFLVNIAIGCLSGYLVPLDLFPKGLRAIVDLLPFRYQIGLPVELLTSAHPLEAAARLVAQQWGYVVVLLGLSTVLWRNGLRRFAAFGG